MKAPAPPPRMETKTCLSCGRRVEARSLYWPKCDNRLDKQTDGSTVTIDIAHQGEKVWEALRKLDLEVHTVKNGIAANLRVIVGSGAIRDAALARLMDYEIRKVIIAHEIASDNAGAIIVHLK